MWKISSFGLHAGRVRLLASMSGQVQWNFESTTGVAVAVSPQKRRKGDAPKGNPGE